MSPTSIWSQYRDELANDPLLVLGLTAALIALATTPLAVAVLGRMDWFKARRGRVLQRPSFASIIIGTMLVMSIPAIFAAMVLKSRTFDRNRYEFDPNRTWSVLEQGRGLDDVRKADQAVKEEMQRLSIVRKNLVDNVKKLDEAMLALRAVAGTSPLVAQRIPAVLQTLAGVRRSIGLDGPQQLEDFTAPPADLRAMAAQIPAATVAAAPAPGFAVTSPVPAGDGLTPAQVEAELATVPEPQRGLAAMLPLSGLPAGWTVGKSGEKHLETFNAENLYEKIDGRAESFIQYGVKGMAYAFYHPTGDPSNELQLYIFEMADPLKALGKYGSEKPEEFQTVAVGDQGYSTAGSTLFYAGKYYTQIVSTADDPRFAAFALDLARRVAARQKPGKAGAAAAAPSVAAAPTPAPAPAGESAETETETRTAETKPNANANAKPAAAEITPATYFGLLPAANRDGEPKYVAQDAFGYSFLSDVFMADYKSGGTAWQGFLRPYRDADEAKAVFQKYVEGVKKDGAKLETIKAEGADEIVVSSNIGLVDIVFRKGNTLAGANGATERTPAEAFAKALARSLPGKVPLMDQ